MFKVSCLLLLSVLAGMGQSTVLTLTGPASARPGTTVNLTLTASGGIDTAAAGLQWTIGLPINYTATAVLGAAPVGKTLACTTNFTTCLIWALNTAIVPNGVIASYTATIPSSAAGSVTFPLTGLISASAAGSAVTTTSGTTYSLAISPKEDLNGDGLVNLSDVQLMSSGAAASVANPAACTTALDQTGDGKCDILDVLHVILKSLGLI